MRRGGRVVECGGLENRLACIRSRGFESLLLRHFICTAHPTRRGRVFHAPPPCTGAHPRTLQALLPGHLYIIPRNEPGSALRGQKPADGYIATRIVRLATCDFADRTFARTLPGSLPREMSRGPGKMRGNVRPNVRSGRDDSLTGEQSAVARRGRGVRPAVPQPLTGRRRAGCGARDGRASHLNIFQIQTAGFHLPAQSHPRRPRRSLRYTGPITSDW